MGIFSRFEGKMEDTFEGAADKMVKAPISPVQIAKKAEKQMRREKMVGAGKQYAPTLYTVLVNPDDDQRLFGYYPTLAGETETYLTAKASEQGLVMDGQPLVRFIVDDGLKHGKFEVIAEPVAAPIIAQLRAEEMQRYGLAGDPRGGARPGGYGAPAPHPQAQPQPYGAPAGYAPAAQPQAYGAPAAAQPYGAAQPQPVQPAAQPYVAAGSPDAYDVYDPYEPSGRGTPDQKPPLPYVPEDEIDYSLDYGEYTFDSHEFADYDEREDAAIYGAPIAANAGYVNDGYDAPQPAAAAPAAAYGAAAGAAGMAAGAVSSAPAVAPDTMVFAGGAQAATPVPTQAAVRARLIDTTNNRAYDLAASRLLIGRESSNDIALADINASRTHAELRFEPQGVWIISDLGSTNGTFVNGVEVTSQALYEGDRIGIGTTNLVFTLG